MASRSSRSPAGRPVRMATSAGPCDSPAVTSPSISAIRRAELRRLDRRRAARMAASGAANAVQRSNEAAPWRSSMSRPSTTSAQPAARAAATSASAPVREIGEIDDLLLGARNGGLVLDRRRVDERRRSPPSRRPAGIAAALHCHVGARRLERLDAASAEPPRPRTSAAARAPRTGSSTATPSVHEPSTRPSREDERVHRLCTLATSSTSSQSSITAFLCGIVTFAPAKPGSCNPVHRIGKPLGGRGERHVGPVEPERREGRVLHRRRERSPSASGTGRRAWSCSGSTSRATNPPWRA